jgi:uncharacterized protein (DUF427 family)
MQSPGHKKWPEHKVQEQHSPKRVKVEINGEVIADSRDVIEVMEDDHPRRFYFPRGDVKMNLLERSETTSECPFKGHANYYNVRSDGQRLQDAVWTYEEPFDEHRDLKERVAFWDDKVPGVSIQASA